MTGTTRTDAPTATDVAAYLNSLDRTSAAPVVVRIGRTEYVGATYTQERDTPQGCRAYDAGERTYYQHGLYLVGSLPASYVRSSHTAYRYPNGARRWYVAGWYDHDEPNDYHPFGRMFQLFPDTHNVTHDDDGNPYDERTIQLIAF